MWVLMTSHRWCSGADGVAGWRVFRGSETEVDADGFFQPHELARVKPSATAPEPRFVDRVQVCRIDIADVITREASFAIQGYVGLRRPFSSGDDGYRHGAQARDQHVDRQHDDRMLTCPRQARVPDITPERVHGLVAVGCNHSSGQRSRLAAVELVVGCREIHFTSAPVQQPEAFSYQLRRSFKAEHGSIVAHQLAGKASIDPCLHGHRPACRLPPGPGAAGSAAGRLFRDCL